MAGLDGSKQGRLTVQTINESELTKVKRIRVSNFFGWGSPDGLETAGKERFLLAANFGRFESIQSIEVCTI